MLTSSFFFWGEGVIIDWNKVEKCRENCPFSREMLLILQLWFEFSGQRSNLMKNLMKFARIVSSFTPKIDLIPSTYYSALRDRFINSFLRWKIMPFIILQILFKSKIMYCIQKLTNIFKENDDNAWLLAFWSPCVEDNMKRYGGFHLNWSGTCLFSSS